MSSLKDRLIKNSTLDYTSSLKDSDIFNEKDMIPTVVPAVNIALSGRVDGGLVPGLTVIAGPSKHFKTGLGLLLCRAFLEKYEDGIIMFYNNEFGAPPSYWESYGIDTDKIVHCPFADMEELKFDIPKQLQEIKRDDKVLFFIDSIGNAASKKEVEDALNEKSVADMTRAKQMKSIFRIITPHLTLKDIPMIAINHTYQEQGMFPKTIVSGGTGVMYSADNVFIMGRQKDANGTEIQGWNFVLNIEKSRFVKEKSKINLKITYENGIDIYSGILDLAIECGLLVQSGAWYQLVDLKTGEVNPAKIRKSAVNAAVLDPIIASDKFKEFVSNKYRVSSGKMFKEDSTESEAEEYMESLEDE